MLQPGVGWFQGEVADGVFPHLGHLAYAVQGELIQPVSPVNHECMADTQPSQALGYQVYTGKNAYYLGLGAGRIGQRASQIEDGAET